MSTVKMHIDLSGCLFKYDFKPQSISDKISIYRFSILTLLTKTKTTGLPMDVHIEIREWHRVLYKKYGGKPC